MIKFTAANAKAKSDLFKKEEEEKVNPIVLQAVVDKVKLAAGKGSYQLKVDLYAYERASAEGIATELKEVGYVVKITRARCPDGPVTLEISW